MIQLNLLPDVKKEFLHAKAMRRKVISLAILATLISGGVLVALGLFLASQKGLVALQTGQIEDKASELSAVENIDEYLTIQAQLAELDGLHGAKLTTSRLFNVLPNLNPADPNGVRFSSVSLVTEGTTLRFQGGVRNISALTTFRDTLSNATVEYKPDPEAPHTEEPLFSSVTIDEYGYSADAENKATAVGFTISAVYNPKMFDTTVESPRILVPNKETTQSVVASPQVTFEEGAGNLEDANE